MSTTNWNQYLHKNVACTCGRVHKCEVDEILIEAGALQKLPDIMKKYSYKNICVISDVNTEAAAGNKVYNILDKADIKFSKFVFPNKALVPDEAAVGAVVTAIDRNCDLILAVGSGTLNDLCKFISYKLKIDYFIIATAPSMDGYASNVSPLIVNHLKTTYEVGMPKVILGDLDVLCQAPMEMIAAGVGDILGKYICLVDWKLAHIIQDEYFCEEMEGLVRKSIQAVADGAPKVSSRDNEAIASVMEGLVLSGIAMSYVGNSRPASGSEHHLSHFWEMMFLFKGEHSILHGTKVGVGTVVTIDLYKKLRKQEIDFAKSRSRKFDFEGWKEEIKMAYGPAADEVISLEERTGKNADAAVAKRIDVIEREYSHIMELIDTLPEAEEIISILNSMDAPFTPEQLGVENETFKNSVRYAKELRNRYGLLQLLFDLNVLDI